MPYRLDNHRSPGISATTAGDRHMKASTTLTDTWCIPSIPLHKNERALREASGDLQVRLGAWIISPWYGRV